MYKDFCELYSVCRVRCELYSKAKPSVNYAESSVSDAV